MSTAENFNLVKNQLKVYLPLMKQASEVIRNEDVSNYPIMVVHKQEVEIGIPMELSISMPGGWKINASTLEEFVSKNVIENEKIDEFRQLYRQHESHVCLFVLSEMGAQFIFFEINQS